MEALVNDGTTAQQQFLVVDTSQVAHARRSVGDLARGLGFSETAAGRVAIVVTECATNILKHAGHGELLVRRIAFAQPHPAHVRVGIELLALDKGPGVRDLQACFEDGYTTAGSAGSGMGAIQRQSDEFDIWSQPGHGMALRAVIWGDDGRLAQPRGPFEFGVVNLPVADETLCGDAWGVESNEDGVTIMVADGLGHGPLANTASVAAVHALSGNARLPVVEIMDRAHEALRSTRGAAIGIARFDGANGKLQFAGVGNISAVVIQNDGTRRQMMSHNGIVGHNMRRAQEVDAPWSPHSQLVMHSDGLLTRWDTGHYPGLALRHPSLIAGVLYRDCSRGRDDVTVLVARSRAQAGLS
ncbi:ATP-binding SpoIIE family protein phosphatase [Paraburkholderia saeva]|uniref:ATP-binding SpoIIE family protein phosphatase n=1 Tax=Paraburkholderia saeva TaxID=2777537 RepID=UPI001DEC2AB0|nr:ATP-binding SpoIIE family protein phosphatase [Paraburkholderia saeva]CAG4894401.1 hypothetical protein R70241_01779 [Paraburkholderia saeva]